MKVITDMTETELYELGQQFAADAMERPDALHRFMLGLNHGLQRNKGWYPQLGESLHLLWRHGMHAFGGKILPIQFHPMNEVPSGSGHLKP